MGKAPRRDRGFQLDILCRFVLVLHVIAKESADGVGVQLAISSDAVNRAYRRALDVIELAARSDLEPSVPSDTVVESAANGPTLAWTAASSFRVH